MAKKQVNSNVNQSFLQTVVNEFTIEVRIPATVNER